MDMWLRVQKKNCLICQQMKLIEFQLIDYKFLISYLLHNYTHLNNNILSNKKYILIFHFLFIILFVLLSILSIILVYFEVEITHESYR